ncbi:unnamed protein product [Arctia plantaginis]|uniref:Uncharacterized protein n=1 Tax=Arctia plantaginis TaxID=874455 RepID=A0A8S0ZNX4_ARCPL|nr:unnamed protein product [Arctia plantaginis]CAB3241993.1 unnamed protein product [Arctia plantaginis]
MIPGGKIRTPDRWAPRRGFWPLPDSGFPWARAPAGPGGGRTTTTIERRRDGDGSRSRSVALPTTGTRLARRGAPRHAAPAPARTRHPHGPRCRRIDSFTPYTIIHTACTTVARNSVLAPPRERAARARAPPPYTRTAAIPAPSAE